MAWDEAIALWRIIEYGATPEHGWNDSIMYNCPQCGFEAKLPVNGRVMAQLSDGALIFASGPRQIPTQIQCRNCKKIFVSEATPNPAPLPPTSEAEPAVSVERRA